MDDVIIPHITSKGDSGASEHANVLKDAFEETLSGNGKLTDPVYFVIGFSGKKIRLLLNNVISRIENAKYMEIGVYCGASFISAVFKNKVSAIGIDNWSWPESKRNYLFSKLADLSSSENSISLLDCDFRSVDFNGMKGYNVLFYDGSHAEKDQYDGVRLPQPSLNDSYILIVDDWNWPGVRRGTMNALSDVAATVTYSYEIRTTLDDSLTKHGGMKSDWHNGLFIGAIRKAG